MAGAKKRPPVVLLIDADTLVFRAATAHEQVINWGDEEDGQEDLYTVHGNLEPAKATLDRLAEGLRKKLNGTSMVMALSDYDRPWRKAVMPGYKENRSGARKPMLIPQLREHVHATYPTVQRQGLEGDDVLGILLTAKSLKMVPAGERILVSLDKDMRTLPGKHYNPSTEERFEVSEAEADQYHMLQTLTGDRVDGYPGCPGVGPKKAEKILDGLEASPGQMWLAVVQAYEKAGLSEHVALQNARVARICRASDYDFKAKQVRLWSPPK